MPSQALASAGAPVDARENHLPSNQETPMTKLKLLGAITILIMSGGAIAIQTIHPASTSAAAQQAGVVLAPKNTNEAAPSLTKIVPAAVVERESSFFVGTGDGSAGVWARP